MMFCYSIKKIDHKRLYLFFLFAACSIGLIQAMYFVAQAIYQSLDFNFLFDDLCAWAKSFSHNKLPQLLHYILALLALFLFMLIYFWGLYDEDPSARFVNFLKNRQVALIYAVVLWVINVWFFTSRRYHLYLCILWFGSFLSVFYLCFRWQSIHRNPTWPEVNCSSSIQPIKTSHSWLGMVLIGLMVLQCIYVFYPLICQPVYVENDFMDLPETTMLASGQYVDNHTFIRQHRLAGLVKYDPRIDLGKTPIASHAVFMHLSLDYRLKQFLDKIENKWAYHYDQAKQRLILLNRPMSQKEYKILRQLYQHDPGSLHAIDQFWRDSLALKH